MKQVKQRKGFGIDLFRFDPTGHEPRVRAPSFTPVMGQTELAAPAADVHVDGGRASTARGTRRSQSLGLLFQPAAGVAWFPTEAMEGSENHPTGQRESESPCKQPERWRNMPYEEHLEEVRRVKSFRWFCPE